MACASMGAETSPKILPATLDASWLLVGPPVFSSVTSEVGFRFTVMPDGSGAVTLPLIWVNEALVPAPAPEAPAAPAPPPLEPPPPAAPPLAPPPPAAPPAPPPEPLPEPPVTPPAIGAPAAGAPWEAAVALCWVVL